MWNNSTVVILLLSMASLGLHGLAPRAVRDRLSSDHRLKHTEPETRYSIELAKSRKAVKYVIETAKARVKIAYLIQILPERNAPIQPAARKSSPPRLGADPAAKTVPDS